MFLPSQLAEIAQRFRPDVEDLQVLLQEEGVQIRSGEGLAELWSRLGVDARFRRDVAFLVQSMLGREPDRPGSMDVLGVLVAAAAGTRLDLGDPLQQQAMRELLRFVIQQRRSAEGGPVADAPAAVEDAPTLAVAAPIDDESVAGYAAPVNPGRPRLVTRREERPSAAAEAVPMPSLLEPEAEPLWRSRTAIWIAAVVVLVLTGAWLLMRGSSATPAVTAVPLPAAAAPVAAAPEPAARAMPAQASHSWHRSSSSSSRRREAAARPVQTPGTTAPLAVPAATSPKAAATVEPVRSAPPVKQPVTSAPVPRAGANQQTAAVSTPAPVVQGRSASAGTAAGNVFAHPEAAAAAAEDVPPPEFHTKDPVLIARNKPTEAGVLPLVRGTVHAGSSGTMASSLMYSPEPEYPAEAISAGVQGEVTVRAVVGPEGNVIDASIVSGPPLLREAALDAVGRWRYRPYEQDGKPLPVATTAILDFQLPQKR